MRGRLVAFCVALAMLVLGCAQADEKTNGERQPAPWAVSGVSADQRTVNLSYERGGCDREDPGVSVDEAEDEIEIELTERTVDQPDDVACLASAMIAPLKGRLRSPLAGRRIAGLRRSKFGSPLGPRHRHGRFFVKLVPRVAGLAVQDAKLVLSDFGFRPRVTGGPADETLGTKPGPGAEGTRTLTLGRIVRVISKPRR